MDAQGRPLGLGGILHGMLVFLGLIIAVWVVVIFARLDTFLPERFALIALPLLVAVLVGAVAVMQHGRGRRGVALGIAGGYALMTVASGGMCTFVEITPLVEQGPVDALTGIAVYVVALVMLAFVWGIRRNR